MTSATRAKAGAPLMLQAHCAEDLMVLNPISLRATAGVKEAMVLFTEKGIAAAPVIDEAGRPIGVVSRSDLLVHQCEHEKKRAGEAEDHFPPSFESAETPDRSPRFSRVAELMTPAVFAVSPDTPVARIVSDMVGLHVHRLFVVDENGILVGVISTLDVLKHLKAEE